MRENVFPIRLESVLYNPNLYDVNTKYYSVVADVIVDIKEPYIAHKIDGKTCFPIGQFRTTVCTGVFKLLLESNCIKQINKIAVYQQAQAFKKFVDFFGREKELFSKAKDKCGVVIAKYYLNRFYGKFGQKMDTLLDEENVPVELVEYIPTYNMETGYNGLIISYGGVRRLLEDRNENARDALVAIAAHVTEFARMLLWDVMVAAGRQNVYYCDTDSVFVNKKGLQNLKKHKWIHPDKLGLLKIEEKTSHCIINTCKDYEFGDAQKRKGIRKDATIIDKNKFQQYHFPGLYSYLKLHPDNYIIQNIVKELSGDYTKGIVKKSGQVLPYVLG